MSSSNAQKSQLNTSTSQNPKSQKDISQFLSSIISSSDLTEKASKYSILEFVKIVGKHKGPAEDIKELKNGYFTSFGIDNKLIVYDKNFNIKIEGEDLSEWIYDVLEITSQEKLQRDIQMILCTNQSLFLNQINVEKNTSRIQRYDCGGVICLELKKNNYIICNEKGVDHFSDLFSKIIQSKKNTLFEKAFRGGIVLNQNLVAFSSNIVLPNGENNLKFYNPNSKKITKEISDKNSKEYSFIMASNGLLLIESEDKSLKKIFLAASKKYLDTQKNGILILASYFDETDTMIETFYPTGNFEVYCFCQLSLIKNQKINSGKILDNKENEKSESIKTNYFLVGGLDEDTRCGLIKLYKAKFDTNAKDTYIEFVQDIQIEKVEKKFEIRNKDKEKENNPQNEDEKFNEYKKKILKERNTFNRFGGPISCMIQSSLTGNILVTCYDGYVYLLTPPNLDYYLCEDKYEEKL